MADVLVLVNPLDPSRRRRVALPEGVPLLAWVDAHAPGFGALTRRVWVNLCECTDRDYRTRADDEVLVAFAPASDPITAEIVFKAIFEAAIATAIGMVLSAIFAPAQPAAANTAQPSQVYGIAPPKNAARLGQPIPVIYGSVVALPDFAAQPYTYFNNNVQYLHALLCVGLGEYDIQPTAMLLGQTGTTTLADGLLKWSVYQPAEHASTFGIIEGITGVRENVVSSPAVADQELVAPNLGGFLVPQNWFWVLSGIFTTMSPTGLDLTGSPTPAAKLAKLPPNPAVGTFVDCILGFNGSAYTCGRYTAATYVAGQSVPPGALIPAPVYSQAGQTKWIGHFETCKVGQHGSLLELDFIFPGGLYSADGSGNLANATVGVTIEAQPINADGTPAGALLTMPETFQAKDNTPQRYTKKYAVPSARYKVRVQRTSNSDLKVSTSDHIVWAGLKFQLDPPPVGTKVYGNVTLIAVQLQASNGVASEAASSMRFRVTRKLCPLGDTNQPTAPTWNPADAFVDVLCAAYGGARPVNPDELDIPELTVSRAAWVSHNGFNAIFDQPSTVWEALSLSVQTVHAAPLPVGSRMSLIHDGVQPVRAQLFTDANIAAGTLQVTANFDTVGTPAGIRVNWRDAQTFSAQALLVPPDAPDFSTIDLFGCTDVAVAQEHATLADAKRRLQRMSIAFTTEKEGLNVLPGDRIGVAAGMVKWAQSARVRDWDEGLVVDVDTALDWTTGSTHAIVLRDPTGAPWRVGGVTRGDRDDQLVLPSAAPFPLVGLYDTLEATTLSFGAVNAEVTDWTVHKVTPSTDTVALECVNYDPAVYAGAADFTRAGFAPVDADELTAQDAL